MQLNINTNACIAFTNKLEKLSRSALPVAVRGALNKAAFDVKMNTMPKKANETFKKRKPNFFKANSRVEMAQGFNVNSMKSTVGFTSTNLQGANNYAVKDLTQQEDGGLIKGRSFVPLDGARTGGYDTPVRANARISKLKNIKNARNSRGKNVKEKFIRAVLAAGKGGYVISGRRQILFKVDSLRSSLKTNIKTKKQSGKFKVKLTPLYKFKKHGKVSVHKTNFMRVASLKAGQSIEKFFEAEAKRQISKI